ncbi:MAG: restriction endonuclease subunit S [Candidatus Competibacteraceae bacterium]|nr:restriction endonuclease subunit S [Candidatus Competibacteraceae bacterium]
MKKGWKTRTLGDICGFVRGPFGGSLKKSVFVENGFAVYEQQHAIYNQFEDVRYFIDSTKFKEMQRFELRPNDLIMSCSGTMGKVAIVPDNIRAGIINQALLKLTPSSAVSSEFLKYWMDSTDFQNSLNEQSGGAAIQNVASVSILKEIKIPLPPLPEQQRIVGILDEAFDGIATAKAKAEKNLKNSRALFESYLQSVFTQRGDNWEVRKIREVAKHSLGKMLDKAKNRGELQPYLRNINVRWFTFDLSDLLQMPFLPKESAKYTAVKGDVLICEGGYPGRAAIWTENYPIYFQKAIHRVRFYETEHNKWFLYYLYAQDKNGELKQHFSGTGIQHFTGEVLARFELPLPPLTEVRRTVMKFEEISAETQRLESIYRRKLAALDELKKSLLHQAFVGEL